MPPSDTASLIAPAERRRARLRAWRRLGLPAALALLVFLSFLGQRDITTSHEARVIQTARQMSAVGWPWEARTVAVADVGVVRVEGNAMRLGPLPDRPPLQVNPWLVPVYNGQIRLQKPPLPYWCDAVLLRLFGFGEGLVRLPAALMGAAGTLLIYGLARRLLGRRGGLVAALVWVSSHFVVSEYRKAMADPYLAFFALLCVWAWVTAASRGDGDGRAASSRARSAAGWALLLLFYVSLALGALAKGPVILLYVGIALSAYHVCWRRPLPGAWRQHVLGIAGLLLIALPWPLYVLARLPSALALWRYESVGRLADNTENLRAWWYYLPNSMLVALPWLPVLLLGLALPFVRRQWGHGLPARVRRRERRQLLPLVWYIATLVCLSFLSDKKNAYLLPGMPAQTLLIAQGLLWVLAQMRRRRRAPVANLLLPVQGLIGVGFAATVPVLVWQRGGLPVAVLILSLLALAASVRPLRASLARGDRRRWLRAQGVGYALVLVVFLGAYMPQRDNQRSPKIAAGQIAALLREPGTSLFTGRLSESALVYLPVGVRYDPSSRRVLMLYRQRGTPTLPAPADVPPVAGRVSRTRLLLLPASGAGRGLSVWSVVELTVERSGRPQAVRSLR